MTDWCPFTQKDCRWCCVFRDNEENDECRILRMTKDISELKSMAIANTEDNILLGD